MASEPATTASAATRAVGRTEAAADGELEEPLPLLPLLLPEPELGPEPELEPEFWMGGLEPV